jgi:UDP-N-acetyl-2-amino-2-deoxyglucuronate dehydrogenase
MTIHAGLIGGGNISETHGRAASAIPGVKVSAVYGTNPEKVERLCQEFGARAFRELDAFLAHRPMNLVIIGSPSGLHADQGIAAAKRGLHILTEKPMDISTKRADELIAATRAAGVKLGVIFQDRMKPDIRRLRELIDGGALGKPLVVEARVKWYRPPKYYAQSKWRGTLALDGGGALMNQGIHTVDLMLWLLGDVTRVKSRVATVQHKIESEDTAVATVEFASGAVGTLLATTAAFPGYPRRLEISGTEGTVVLEHDRIVAIDLRNAPAPHVESAATDQNQSASSPVVSDFRGHQAVIEDFLAAIEQDRAPVCDGAEGRRSVALVEEIYRVARA